MKKPKAFIKNSFMANFALNQHEYSYDTGDGFVANISCSTENSLDNGDGTYTITDIPNVPIGINMFRVRVKASSGNKASSWLYNNVAFTGAAPVGRSFNVGTGTGDLVIDGNDNTKEWYPLQPNDEFKIAGGNYQSITFKDLKAGSDGEIKVTNQNTTINVETVSLDGLVMKINCDFYNKVSGTNYGLVIEKVGDFGERLRIDEQQAGGFEMIFKGIDNRNFNDRGWRTVANNVFYNDGLGKVSVKLLDVQFCRWTNDNPDEYRGRAIDLLGGNLDQGLEFDYNYVDKFIFKNNILENGQYDVVALNVGDFEVSDIFLNNINSSVPAEGPGHYHARTIDMGGTGYIRNVKAVNSFGIAARIIPFNRTSNGTKRTSIMANIASYNNTRYSAAEVNNYEGSLREYAGVTVRNIVKVYGVTALNLGTANVYTSLALDIYFEGETYAYNCVAAGCYNGGLGNVAINDPSTLTGGSNNVGYVDNTLTKISTSTLKPAADSVLKGAGIYSADNLLDLNGQTRLNPPTIGAIEAL